MSGMTATSPHCRPSQRASRGDLPVRVPTTAHVAVDVAARAETHGTPGATAAGSRVRVHAVPFQCKTSGPRPVDPTAHASVAELAATSSKVLLYASFGTGTRRIVVPVTRTMSGLPIPPPSPWSVRPYSPTTHP